MKKDPNVDGATLVVPEVIGVGQTIPVLLKTQNGGVVLARNGLFVWVVTTPKGNRLEEKIPFFRDWTVEGVNAVTFPKPGSYLIWVGEHVQAKKAQGTWWKVVTVVDAAAETPPIVPAQPRRHRFGQAMMTGLALGIVALILTFAVLRNDPRTDDYPPPSATEAPPSPPLANPLIQRLFFGR